jgi:CheY-specific phosphatase CheX
MPQLEQSISEIVETVWSSMLGLQTEPDTASTLTVGGAESSPVHTYAGVVQISGAWAGAVAVQCSETLARHAASTMFGLTPETVAVADVHDALGELANMTGGNIKALLPEPCTLGLPVVIEGADYRLRLPGSLPVQRLAFRVGEESVVVSVLVGS